MVTYKSKCISSFSSSELSELVDKFLNKNCGNEDWIIHEIQYSTSNTNSIQGVIFSCLIILMQK